MDTQVNELLRQAMQLSDHARLELAEAILASVTPSAELPFDPQWLVEVTRRAARIDSGAGKLSSWPEVRERGRQMLEEAAGD